MNGILFIVELEKDVYIAPWDGDPGRTVVRGNAERFEYLIDANTSLDKARGYRPFKDAKVRIF